MFRFRQDGGYENDHRSEYQFEDDDWARFRSGVPVAFRTVARGADSRIDTRVEVVARTAGSWQLIWYKHRGTYDPPEIDPRREMVVAVFAGRRATGAFTLEIVSANREDGALVVRYRAHVDPGVGRDTTPFHIIAVAADGAAVRFVEVPD